MVALGAVCKHTASICLHDSVWVSELARLSQLTPTLRQLPERWEAEPAYHWYGRCYRLADFEATRAAAYVAGAFPHLRRYGVVGPGATFTLDPRLPAMPLPLEHGTLYELCDLFGDTPAALAGLPSLLRLTGLPKRFLSSVCNYFKLKPMASSGG